MSAANGQQSKPLAYLGMPCYGELTCRAARGFYRATAGKLAVQIAVEESSLLALNMNNLWCRALTALRQGTAVSYFAMQHADIEPEDFWLDKLTDELERLNLDVLGVVAPIKDTRGVTSTALARPDGDTWRVHTRLTMREIARLPETFTSDDLGYPVLINTGLWVCRFDPAWVEKVHFTINDRIVYSGKDDKYHAEVESEDWFFSRLLHELGLRVGVTRKIDLGHRGAMVFTNQHEWGEQYFDEAHVTESVIPEESAPAREGVSAWR